MTCGASLTLHQISLLVPCANDSNDSQYVIRISFCRICSAIWPESLECAYRKLTGGLTLKIIVVGIDILQNRTCSSFNELSLFVWAVCDIESTLFFKIVSLVTVFLHASMPAGSK